MSDPRAPLDDIDGDLRQLLDAASAGSVPPTPFDPALALAAGQRRRARRRTAGAALTTACLLAAGVVLLTDARDRPAGPPGDGQTPTPTASADAFPDGGEPGPRLQRVLNNVSGFFGRMHFADADHAAAVQYSCTEDLSPPDCDSAVLVTRDGFRSAVAHLVPGTDLSWVWALPDGSAAYDTGDGVEMILPDNSIAPVSIETEPAEAGTGVLVTMPVSAVERLGPGDSSVGVLDPATRTLAPLAGGPRGAVTIGADGTVAVTRRTGDGPAPVAVSTSQDDGRTWRSAAEVETAAPDTVLAPVTISGPRGRLALVVVSEGGAVTTLDDLWVSDDRGATWRRMPRFPRLMNGVTFADDGSLLVTDPDSDAIWRSDQDLTSLSIDPTLPSATAMISAGARTVMRTGAGNFTSADGLHWRRLSWTPQRFTSVDRTP